MKYLLRDREPRLVAAWQKAFQDVPEVEASCGDIFDLEAVAIVSPANSFGFMDGGIDLAYSLRFGWDLQKRLQALLRKEYDGELLVGQAVLLETRDKAIPYLISAPTMRVPMSVDGTVNAYLAFRAVLRLVNAYNVEHPDAIPTVLCPGLGTATGLLPFDLCAKQMRTAWQNVQRPPAAPVGVNDILLDHYAMLHRASKP
ncbi:MAG TPA: macro domain-containing protein [Chthonomonadaceae bacterium]|nr:macro domain-containing protein [Chthonomonadaceae bacterium]